MVTEGNNPMTEVLLGILDPLRTQNRAALREIAQDLKKLDDEHWAVGEMLERACIFLIALDVLNIADHG